MSIHMVPINAESSIWNKTNIYDEVAQNIEDLINSITTEHQQDNSKTADENSDQLGQFLQGYSLAKQIKTNCKLEETSSNQGSSKHASNLDQPTPSFYLVMTLKKDWIQFPTQIN